MLKLFNEIVIPCEVYNEVVTNGLFLGAADAGAVDFLVCQGHILLRDVDLPSSIPEWAQTIDKGEMAVIVLALQESVDWVLIDNAHARKEWKERH